MYYELWGKIQQAWERIRTMPYEEKVKVDDKLERVIGWMQVFALLLVLVTIAHAQIRRRVVYDGGVSSAAPATSALAIENQRQIATLDYRLDSIQHQVDKLDNLQLEHRLTALESSSDTNREILIGIAIAVGTMFIDSIHRLLRPVALKREPPGDDGYHHSHGAGK